MNNKQQKGSRTAKEGFRNEDDVVNRFNNWKQDSTAQAWLIAMEYDIDKIEFVKAVKLSRYKTDVQVQLTIKSKQAIDVENLQVKLVSNLQGFNQIDKRWVDKYVQMWDIPEHVASILERYTGEAEPSCEKPRDKRRMFANEFTKAEQEVVMAWLNENKTLIVSDILKGRGKFAAEWMLVVQKVQTEARWVLKSMNFCMNYFGAGEVVISPKGNFKIGKITMQRKGGDNGRPTANMLQFKINPAKLFDCNDSE